MVVMGQVLTIDTGGTKTRVVQFSEILDVMDAFDAPVIHMTEFPTPYDQNEYIAKVAEVIRGDFPELSADAVLVLGIRGIVMDGKITDPKLGWVDFPIAERLEKATGRRVMVENDAKLGALGAFGAGFSGRGLYLTIGTGVGSALAINNVLSRDMGHTEVGHMMLKSDNGFIAWQDIASGTYINKKYGRHGHEIPGGDPIWHEYAENLGSGILAILPIFYPDLIAIGGGVANQFDYYGEILQKFVRENTEPHLRDIKIVAAHDPIHTVNRGGLVFYCTKTEEIA